MDSFVLSTQVQPEDHGRFREDRSQNPVCRRQLVEDTAGVASEAGNSGSVGVSSAAGARGWAQRLGHLALLPTWPCSGCRVPDATPPHRAGLRRCVPSVTKVSGERRAGLKQLDGKDRTWPHDSRG